MALTTPNDRLLLNVISTYERELMGPKLTTNELARIAESMKRMMMDEIQSAKSAH